jgi:membrane fusion protein (multidrug efflux system)
VRDRRGRPTAWVVNGDGVIEERSLSILQDRGTDWVVEDGLSAGDRIVIEGFQKTAPGATVNAQERAQAPGQAASE